MEENAQKAGTDLCIHIDNDYHESRTTTTLLLPHQYATNSLHSVIHRTRTTKVMEMCLQSCLTPTLSCVKSLMVQEVRLSLIVALDTHPIPPPNYPLDPLLITPICPRTLIPFRNQDVCALEQSAATEASVRLIPAILCDTYAPSMTKSQLKNQKYGHGGKKGRYHKNPNSESFMEGSFNQYEHVVKLWDSRQGESEGKH